MTVKPREKPLDGDEDPVENMLKKTGCLELHYKVQVGTFYIIIRYIYECILCLDYCTYYIK